MPAVAYVILSDRRAYVILSDSEESRRWGGDSSGTACPQNDGGRMTGDGDGAWLLEVGATGRSPRRSLRSGFFGHFVPSE